jgi:NAD(P)-dependent dehydrogenase (short-subunit alcohol dehydrogenase family)
MVNIEKNGQASITRSFMLGLMLMGFIVTGLQSQTVQADDHGKNYVPTVLITGANRGIGFEFVKQYTAKGWKVIATCRTPDKEANLAAFAAENNNVVIEQIDVKRHDMIDKVAIKYKKQPIDVLINNAGHTLTDDTFMQQIFGQINYALAEEYFRTNSLGALKMAEAFADSVAQSRHKKIVSISSLLGSVTMRSGPGMYFYSMSKAALNIGQIQVAKDTKHKGLIVALLSPGLVDKKETKGADDQGLVKGGRVPIKMSIAGMIKVIDALTPERAGSFTRWDGEDLTW